MTYSKSIQHIFLLGFILIALCFLAGCSSLAKTSTYDVHSEIVGEEKDEIIGVVNERIYENVERGHEKEEPTILSAIYRGGKDATVQEGRYVITGSQAGVITLLDEEGTVWFKELLFGNQITVSLLETDTVHADAGFDDFVSITKAEEWTEPFLTNGIWEVGKDIEAGIYKFFTEGGHGFMHIYEKNKSPRLYEMIGEPIDDEVDQTYKAIGKEIYKEITLREGQHIRVTGTTVHYEKLSDVRN